MRTYDEHLAWCKQRAREYLDHGDIAGAVASMLSDMNKHEETQVHPMLQAYGLLVASRFDMIEAKMFIEGFR